MRHHSLSPEQREAEISKAVERIRSELRPRAMKWSEVKTQRLIRIETRFEARYSYWEAEAIERVQRLSQPRASKLADRSLIDRVPKGELVGTEVPNWESVEITFLSDERVQILNGTNTYTFNYDELGFADSRSEKPNQAWVILRALAAANGTVRDAAGAGCAWPKVEKRMQEIRKAFRKLFDIPGDPIPFVMGRGYVARFKIGCSPSFHT